VHQEQLKHIQKGCLERSDQDIRSDGSRIEGTHKGWNSLQHAQPSGIVMLSALGHDFVLRRNIRVASSRRQMTPFVKFTHSSHHIQLSNHIARLYNGLREKDTRLLPLLPELPDVDSGETFGLVASDNTTTFGGLLIKEETADAKLTLTHNFEVCTDSFTGGTIDFATEASRSIMIEDWQIDPALLDQPATQPLLPHATKVIPASPSKRKVSCVSFDANDELDSDNTSKRPRTLVSAGTKTLDGYFSSGHVIMRPREPHRPVTEVCCHTTILDQWYVPPHPTSVTRENSLLNSHHRIASALALATQSQRYVQSHPTSVTRKNSLLNSLHRIASALALATQLQRYVPPHPTSVTHENSLLNSLHRIAPALALATQLPPDLPSAGINNAITRSQHLFSIATGIDPRSLTFQNSDEFYLFMNMQAEFKWVSYQMTSKCWVLAMEEYNRCLTQEAGRSVIQKNPQALLCVLGDIEPKLMNRIIRGEYTSKRNNETFWRHHCSVVPLVKEERGKKPRKAQTCSRCQTIMYPGPENSPLNHKRGYCADGVKQVSKNSSEDLPPWPQPQGLFSEGRTFHLHAFLLAVQCVYEYVSLQGPGEMDLLETEAFAKLLVSRTEICQDGAVLFRLFTDFIVDPLTPRDRIVVRDDKQWLRINFLQQL
ncbi:hypothetical protein BDR06DRAFT_1066230, partial [Suillus hirtellus]